MGVLQTEFSPYQSGTMGADIVLTKKEGFRSRAGRAIRRNVTMKRVGPDQESTVCVYIYTSVLSRLHIVNLGMLVNAVLVGSAIGSGLYPSSFFLHCTIVRRTLSL